MAYHSETQQQQVALTEHDFDEEAARLEEQSLAFQHLIEDESERISYSTPELLAAKKREVDKRIALAAALLQRLRSDCLTQQQQQPTTMTMPTTAAISKANHCAYRRVLNKWFLDHIAQPYPTEEEKKMLAAQTGLSIQQLCTWFGNKRMRFKHNAKHPHSPVDSPL